MLSTDRVIDCVCGVRSIEAWTDGTIDVTVSCSSASGTTLSFLDPTSLRDPLSWRHTDDLCSTRSVSLSPDEISSLLSCEDEHWDDLDPLIMLTIVSGQVAIETSHAKNIAQHTTTMIMIARSSFISWGMNNKYWRIELSKNADQSTVHQNQTTVCYFSLAYFLVL